MAHAVRQDIHSAGELLAFSKTSGNVRHSHRILAIRDRLRGELRRDICERYGVTRENLRHWVSWYNESGVDGLKDEARSGRPKALPAEKTLPFKARIEAQPDAIVFPNELDWKYYRNRRRKRRFCTAKRVSI